MTAPTPREQIPDAAVEAFLRASNDVRRQCHLPALSAGPGVSRAAARDGLAAALPHLLPAAPSGETAPLHVPLGQVYADGRWVEVVAPAPAGGEVAAASVPAKPDPCGHTIAGIGAQVLICTRPNGHDGAHADMYGAQWPERPTGTDAQTTPADPNSCRHCGVPQRSHGQRWVPDAGVHGWTEPTPEQRKQRMLDRHRTNAQATPLTPAEIKQAAADCRDQIIAAAAQAIGRARTNAQATPAHVLDLVEQYSTTMWMVVRAEVNGAELSSQRHADASWQLLDQIRAALAAPSGEPTTEPAGEVDRG